MPTKKDLQQRCKAAGLDEKGKVSELIQRLEEYNNRDSNRDPSSSPYPPDLWDAELRTQVMVSDEEDRKTEGKDVWGKAPEKDMLQVSIERIRGNISVGNSRRTALAGFPERLRILEESALLEDKRLEWQDQIISSQDQALLSFQGKVRALESDVTTLKLAGKDYRRVRERFISTFVRDNLDNATPSDHDTIKEVNVTVHVGDASYDARLYEGAGARPDSHAFEELYGMHPTDVMKINHEETIVILNLHATVRANKDRTGTPDFYLKFREFIKEFKRSNFRVTYLSADPTDKTLIAYKELERCKIYTPSTDEQK